MKNPYVIKTHSNKVEYSNPHFFILSKGLNSGKPLKEPCANSFVVKCKTKSIKKNVFWLCYSLWQSKSFHQHLRGSVIPFIRIGDLRNILNEAYSNISVDKNKFDQAISTVKRLELKRKQYYENLLLIEEAKRIVLHRYIRNK